MLMSSQMTLFRIGVLEGRWDVVDGLIDSGLGIESSASRLAAHIIVLRQKYLELLERGSAEEALQCLRNQLTPLYQQHVQHSFPHGRSGSAVLPSVAGGSISSSLTLGGDSLSWLGSLLLCQSASDLRIRSAWSGASGGSRDAILRQLSSHIPSSLLLPENRLQTLLQQAILWQQTAGSAADLGSLPQAVHQSCGSLLLQDSPGLQSAVPGGTCKVLERHTEEVWLASFSRSGQFLASASKDSIVVVWDMLQPMPRSTVTLRGHSDGLGGLAWSPDDCYLLTCGRDQSLVLWARASGERMRTYYKHSDDVVACAWLPDGQSFVSAGVDRLIVLWAVEGHILQSWTAPRVHDLSVDFCGDRLVAISELEILLCPLSRHASPQIDVGAVTYMPESQPITSLCLSVRSPHLLVNVSSLEVQEVHLWDASTQALVHRYRGHRQERFVLRACFGGADESLVLSGSEDSQIYIWNRYNEDLIATLPGHSGSVNAVSWCPGDSTIFASASDDHTVRVWSTNASRCASPQQYTAHKT